MTITDYERSKNITKEWENIEKRSQITYSNSWKYLYAAQRGLEHRKADKQISVNVSGMVHTRVEVCRMDLEMSRLVEWPWLQLMCCAVCLLHSCNFRWWGEVQAGSEYWLVCCCWTLEIEYNKRLSSLIIRLANYSVTTSLIYK